MVLLSDFPFAGFTSSGEAARITIPISFTGAGKDSLINKLFAFS